MSENKFHPNAIMNDIFADTAANMAGQAFGDVVKRVTEFAESKRIPLEEADAENMVKEVVAEQGFSIETGEHGEPIITGPGSTARRWNELAGLEIPAVNAGPEPPPFSIPINDLSRTVEVAPGILVSEHLIRDAVAATSEPGAIDAAEARAAAKKKMFDELRQDIDMSKKVVQSMVERIKNPPNLKEKFISYDAMPPSLQRVVNAYIAASDANRELDEAIKALAAEPRSSS